MENDLKKSNTEKNEEFDRIVKTYLVISSAITIIVAIIAYSIGGGLQFVLGAASLLIAIGLFYYTYSGDECPECSARKYEERLSTDLAHETFLGNKTKKNSLNEAFTIGGTPTGKVYTKYAVFNRTYNYHSICKYCGYEWEGTYTVKEEEEL
jgi:hypothetical protein